MPIRLRIQLQLDVVVLDPGAVTGLAADQLRAADIDWSQEEDDRETAAAELSVDLRNAVAGLADPHRMFEGVPGLETAGGRIWAEFTE